MVATNILWVCVGDDYALRSIESLGCVVQVGPAYVYVKKKNTRRERGELDVGYSTGAAPPTHLYTPIHVHVNTINK